MGKVLSYSMGKRMVKGYEVTFNKTVANGVKVTGYAKKGTSGIIVTRFPKGAMKLTKTVLVNSRPSSGTKKKKAYSKKAKTYKKKKGFNNSLFGPKTKRQTSYKSKNQRENVGMMFI